MKNEKVCLATNFEDLEAFKLYIYDQFNKMKPLVGDFSLNFDDFNPEFNIKFDYFEGNKNKKVWLYSVIFKEDSSSYRININGVKYVKFKIDNNFNVILIHCEGDFNIGKIGDSEFTLRMFKFDIDFLDKNTNVKTKYIYVQDRKNFEKPDPVFNDYLIDSNDLNYILDSILNKFEN